MYLLLKTTLSDRLFFPVRANAVWTSHAPRYKEEVGIKERKEKKMTGRPLNTV